ncbi:MAG: hypothetical protein WEC12_05875 [Balneolaceae bacterium]
MKIFAVYAILLLYSGQVSDCRETVEGYLQLYGSDHFPQLAVVTGKHGRLFLDVTAEQRNDLWNNREGYIRITGRIYEDQWMGKPHAFIRMDKWEWIDTLQN